VKFSHGTVKLFSSPEIVASHFVPLDQSGLILKRLVGSLPLLKMDPNIGFFLIEQFRLVRLSGLFHALEGLCFGLSEGFLVLLRNRLRSLQGRADGAHNNSD